MPIQMNRYMIKYIRLQCLVLTLGLLPVVSMAASYQIDSAALSDNTITQSQNTMIESNLIQKKYREAIIFIDNELKKDPNNVKLLYKKASIYADIEQYDNAITTLDQIAAIKPDHPEAIKLRLQVERLQKAEPHNELGFNDDEAYVSNVKGYWTFASLHYYRFTHYGIYGARINSANRYGTSGKQYQLEANPTFPGTNFLQYVHLSAAYANFAQTLFPNYQYAIEPYFNVAPNLEMSLGFYGLRSIGVNIYTYTGSIAYYLGNNYIWLRPYHYTPKSSDFFELGIRHYFDDKNTYISLKAGIGKAPDILDLAPLNQIVVLDQNLIAINGQFAVHKNIYLQVGAGYLRQVYPNTGNVREISDGNLGILWQF